MQRYLAFAVQHARVLGALFVIGIIGVALVVRQSQSSEPLVQAVQTATAIRADVADMSSFSGTLEPVREVDIGSKSGGRITTLAVEVGSRVGVGALIAQLDASHERATHVSLTNSIEAARTSLSAVDAYYVHQIASAEGSVSGDATRTQTASIAAITDAAILARRIDDVLGTIFSLRDGAPTGIAAPFAESDLSARDGQAKILARSALAEFQHADAAFQKLFDATILNAQPSAEETVAATGHAVALLTSGKNVLSAAYTVLAATISSGAADETRISTYKSSVADLGSQAQRILQSIHDTTTGLDALKKERDAKLADAQAQITALEGQRTVTETLLQDGTISAPFAGVVTTQSVERGAVVSPGTPLVHLVDDTQLKLVLGVPDADARSYRKGDTATIILDDNRSVSARISKVIPVADAASRKISIELTVANGAHTIPAGTYARALFSKSIAAGVAVPRAAVLTQYDMSSVFVLKDGIVRRRIVEIGAQSDDLVEIQSGLQAGETVVTSGVAYLRDGDAAAAELQ